MSFFSWLRSRTSTRSRRWDGFQIRPAAPRFRPRLEALEDRWLLSTLTVTNNLDSGPGSLRAEIAAAHNIKDTIVFAPSLTGQTITLTSAELLISTGVTIQGPGAGQLTVSGNNQFRVFEVNAGQPVALTGLTISNGRNGILNHTTLTISSCTITQSYGGVGNSGTLTVSGCTISGNRAVGIGNSGTLTVSGCTISGNIIGGINNIGTMTVSGCTITGNHSTVLPGGGIRNLGTLTVSDSTIAGNSASNSTGHGGGLFAGGTVTLTNCTLSDNFAQYGGGAVYADTSSSVTLTNCTLANNSTGFGSYGGGLFVNSGTDLHFTTVNVTNCTVSGNGATFGGGIYVNTSWKRLILNNTIVAGNTVSSGFPQYGPDIYGYVSGAIHNLVGDATGSNGIFNGRNGNIVGGNGLPVINADLGPLQNNGGPTQTMALLAGSPAIGHADNTFAPAKDQRGFTRLDVPGENTDIGAFEL